jgi:hypothetical protein
LRGHRLVRYVERVSVDNGCRIPRFGAALGNQPSLATTTVKARRRNS